MNLKYISLVFCVGGILLLYFLSTIAQPTLVELHEISKYEGKQVVVQGTVTENRQTNYGSQIITIRECNASATIFVEGSISVEYGDIIQATGKVEKYNDEWEIIVNNIRLIQILRKWHNITIPLRQLANNPMNYEGLNVNVSGTIDIVYESYFYLNDLRKENSIIVFYKNSNNIYYPGKHVNLAGRFSFDPKDFRYKIDLIGNYSKNKTCSGEIT